MAAEIGWAGLGIIPTFDKFGSNLERGTSKAMITAGITGGEAFGDSAGKSAGSRFNSRLKSVAKIGAIGLAATAAAAFKFGGDAIGEAREAQKVGALTESTIRATGKAAKVTAAQVSRLSGAISEKSGIDDEAIQSGANMLLTFKNIRNEAGKGNKIFDLTTKATADMAAAMAGGKGGEIDLRSSSILLGKALNDPVKGLSALTRVGVQFTDQQKAINKALVEGGELNALAAIGTKVTAAEFNKVMKDNNATYDETVRILTGPLSRAQQKYFDHLAEGGNTLEAQKQILKEVNSQFGGAAAAQSTEADKLRVAYGNLKEEVGTALLPVMDDLAVFLRKKGIPAARDFAGYVKDDLIPAAKDLGDDLKPVVDGLKDVVKWVDKLPKEAKLAGLAAIVGGIGVAKIRGGGGGGALGNAGKVLGITKPVKVYVVNQTGGGSGGVPGKDSKIPPVLATPGLLSKVGRFVGRAATVLPAAGAYGNDTIRTPKLSLEDARKMGILYDKNLGIVNDAFLKVRGSTEKARDSVRLYDVSIDGLPNDISLAFNTPGLGAAISNTQKYGAYLSDIPRRVVTDFIANRSDKNEGQLERFGGHLASGGSTRAGYRYRVGEHGPEDFIAPANGRVVSNQDLKGGRGGDTYNVTVMADDPWKWKRDMEHMQLSAAVGGADFRG